MKFFVWVGFSAILLTAVPALAGAVPPGGACQGDADCVTGNICDSGICKLGSRCPAGTATGTTCLTNPLGSAVTVPTIIGVVINGVFSIVGALTLVMFVLGGFKWLTSGGNSEKVQEGTNTVLWAALGLIAVFSSYIVLNTVLSFLSGGTAPVEQQTVAPASNNR